MSCLSSLRNKHELGSELRTEVSTVWVTNSKDMDLGCDLIRMKRQSLSKNIYRSLFTINVIENKMHHTQFHQNRTSFRRVTTGRHSNLQQ